MRDGIAQPLRNAGEIKDFLEPHLPVTSHANFHAAPPLLRTKPAESSISLDILS